MRKDKKRSQDQAMRLCHTWLRWKRRHLQRRLSTSSLRVAMMELVRREWPKLTQISQIGGALVFLEHAYLSQREGHGPCRARDPIFCSRREQRREHKAAGRIS
nr:uncharacterized protein LOC105488773 [Macaca nemestrina]